MGQIFIFLFILGIIILVLSKVFSAIKYIITFGFLNDILSPYRVKKAKENLLKFAENNELFDLDQIKKYLARKKIKIKDQHLEGIIEDMEDDKIIKPILLNGDSKKIWQSNFSGEFTRPVIKRKIDL